MSWRFYLLLAFLGLVVAVIVAVFQSAPGYMDADYYYADGVQLATGHGFTEPYIWNFLDNPSGLPHPSHGYWMPLASLIAAAGASLFGPASWSAARIGFLAVAACLPPLTAALAWSFTSRRALAWTSGLLAVFSGFYLPYLSTTDTFGLYMLFGGLFFLILNRKSSIINSLFLGLLAGLMHLSRADGLLWPVLAVIAVLLFCKPKQSLLSVLYSLLSVLAGYLLVMTPWFIRNMIVFGSPLAPGGSKMLWLTSYDQIFSFPASGLTFSNWIQSGWYEILKVRLWALGLNLANAFSVQGVIFLWPLGLIGAWYLRKEKRVLLALLAWFLTLTAMTVAFPFAGARGGFFHSGAATQTMWWTLIPIGLDRVNVWGVRVLKWKPERARLVFPVIFVSLAALLTGVITFGKLEKVTGSGWNQESDSYREINSFLVLSGISGEEVVIVANPPGFWLVSGHPAVSVPDGGAETVLAVARKFNARVLVLEKESTPTALMDVYDHPNDFPGLTYLGEMEGTRVFTLQP
jgi:hypothetical protein